MSYEFMALRDLHDWYAMVNGEENKVTPWPAPWDEEPMEELSDEEVAFRVEEIKRQLQAHYKAAEE